MYNIQTLNNISAEGLTRLPDGQYNVSDDIDNPDGILVRSFKMHEMDFGSNLEAVGRAGAGADLRRR